MNGISERRDILEDMERKIKSLECRAKILRTRISIHRTELGVIESAISEYRGLYVKMECVAPKLPETDEDINENR